MTVLHPMTSSPALSTWMRRLARQSWQSGASCPRPSCHARTPHRLRAPTNGSSHGPLLHTQATTSRRSQPKRPPEETTNKTHEDEEDHELLRTDPLSTRRAPPDQKDCQKNEEKPPQRRRLGVLRALIFLLASCSALLRAPAGSFEKGAFLSSNASLLPVYRSAPLPAPVGSFEKGGVPHFQRLTPMNRPMTNDLPLAARGKNRRENPRATDIPS